MAGGGAGWGSRYFPEIRICFRAKPAVMLRPWAQATVLSVVVAAAAALSYLGIAGLGYKRLAADKEAAIARARSANADLHDDIIGMRQRLAALTQARGEAETRIAVLASQADALRGLLDAATTNLQALETRQDRLSQQRGDIERQLTASQAAATAKAERIKTLTDTLDQTRQALQQAQTQSSALDAQLRKNDAERTAEEAQFAHYKGSLEELARQLQKLEAAHGSKASRARARLGELWRELARAPLLPSLRQVAAAPVTPAKRGGAVVAELGREEITAFEMVLASAGLDVAHLLSQFGARSAEGGPFVPPPKNDHRLDTADPKRLAAIRGLARALPLTAPLADYTIGSPFGARTDPFNRKAAYHTGVDMDAAYKSPVYATAPGVVIHAGWLGDYGKVVEIDHGLGVTTLYAHLHSCLVKLGQQVAAHEEIGLVGTTGRSSGPHVHYEVRVNGEPQDPQKFIGLAQLIPAAAHLAPTALNPASVSVTPTAVTPTAGAPAKNSR